MVSCAPVARLDGQRIAVDLFDLAAHAHGWLLRERHADKRDPKTRTDQRPLPMSDPHDLPPRLSRRCGIHTP